MARTMQEAPKKRMSTAKRVAKNDPTGAQAPTHDEIAQRARELFEESGYPSNRDLEFWLEAERQLREVLKAHDVPLLLVETATGAYRGARGMWRADTLPIPVDAVVCFPGGQLGFGFVSDRYYVAEKLTLISTWDGDELALTRTMWELRVARQLPLAQRASELRKALEPFGEVQGEGFYLTIDNSQADVIARRLLERSIRVGVGVNGEDKHLRFAPALNVTSEEITKLAAALREVVQ